jgi:hypothetical protein
MASDELPFARVNRLAVKMLLNGTTNEKLTLDGLLCLLKRSYLHQIHLFTVIRCTFFWLFTVHV